MENKYLRTLTSLRFFASILIVIHHLRDNFIPVLRGNEKFGILGVTFFLVLSGFIIRYVYGPFKNLKESCYFLWNRVVRIYPLHLITLMICLLYIIKQGFTLNARLVLINSLLLQSYFPLMKIYYSFNILSWSLSTLFFFYLLFSIANLKRQFFYFIVLIAIAGLIFSVYYIETNPLGQDTLFNFWLLYIFPPTRLVTILFGVGMCIIFKKYRRQWCARLGMVRGTLLETISLLLVIDFFSWGYFTQFVQRVIVTLPINVSRSSYFLIPNYITAPLPLLALIFVFALEKGIFSRILQTRFCVYLGEMSFSLFIIHQILIALFLNHYEKFLLSCFGQEATILLVIIFIMLVALLIYRYIEVPIRNRLRVTCTG